MMECRLAGETEVLGENLPQRHFCPSQNPTCPPGFEHGPPWYQPQLIADECGALGGMRIGRGNRSTWRKPASVLLCPPQIPHDLTWAQTRATEVGSQRLTAWAMAQPQCFRNWCICTISHVGEDPTRSGLCEGDKWCPVIETNSFQ
jgi:hypothetical protein